tara:strand:- start:11 stop:781 length:771 start_codon:yes stop_codon:yes gene_type:complete
MKIAIISDIHSNADALSVVLRELETSNVDLTIFLGDILTYGCQPLEVFEILRKYDFENSTVFIKGNHDQIYFDIQSGFKKTDYKLPKFVIDSILWTSNEIKSINLESEFVWCDDFSIGEIYFSHANPFEAWDWRYIENLAELNNSFSVLQKKGYFAGIFGHSHRQVFTGKKGRELYELNNYCSTVDDVDQLIVNSGSVGQPRGKGLGYLIVEINNNELKKVCFIELVVNLDNSIFLIEQANFIRETQEKLIRYLRS